MTGDLLGGAAEVFLEKGGVMTPIGEIIGLGQTMNFIEQIKINVTLGCILQMDITLDPPIEQAIQLLKSGYLGIGFSVKKHNSKTSTPQAAAQANNQTTIDNTSSSALSFAPYMNKVCVRLHYGGLSSRWFKGLLLQPEIDISVEGVSITLKAIGMLFSSHKSLAPVIFNPGTTKQQAIEKLLTSEVHVTYKDGAKAKLQEPMETTKFTYPSGKSWFEHANDIAATAQCKIVQTGGYTPDGQQQVNIFHVSEARTKQSVKASFVAYRQINPQNREFPLISFSAPIQNLLLGPYSGFSVAKGAKQFTYEDSTDSYESRGPVPASSDKAMGGGFSMASTNQQGDSGGMVQPDQAKPMYPSPTSFLDTLRGWAHDFVDKVFEYEITSVGVVDLLPGCLVHVGVANVAELTGVFDLYEVEHMVSSSGVETRMRMIRTGGFLSLVAEDVEQVKNDITTITGSNTKPPKISTSTGTITQ
jgi:hypothetical protein